MSRYKSADLANALAYALADCAGTVILHAGLHALGRPNDIQPRDLPAWTVESIMENLGTTGTLAVPTFNFDFCRGLPFDIAHTPSKGMGSVAEQVRTDCSAIRTPHPMQSLAAVGAQAESLRLGDPKCAYAQEGAFGQLLALDATLLLIGVGFEAASIVHFAEYGQRVPYRFIKSFAGEYIDELGRRETRSYELHARHESAQPILQLSRLDDWLAENSRFRITRVGHGLIRAVPARELVQSVDQHLEKDALALLANADSVKSSLRGAY